MKMRNFLAVLVTMGFAFSAFAQAQKPATKTGKKPAKPVAGWHCVDVKGVEVPGVKDKAKCVAPNKWVMKQTQAAATVPTKPAEPAKTDTKATMPEKTTTTPPTEENK